VKSTPRLSKSDVPLGVGGSSTPVVLNDVTPSAAV